MLTTVNPEEAILSPYPPLDPVGNTASDDSATSSTGRTDYFTRSPLQNRRSSEFSAGAKTDPYAPPLEVTSEIDPLSVPLRVPDIETTAPTPPQVPMTPMSPFGAGPSRRVSGKDDPLRTFVVDDDK